MSSWRRFDKGYVPRTSNRLKPLDAAVPRERTWKMLAAIVLVENKKIRYFGSEVLNRDLHVPISILTIQKALQGLLNGDEKLSRMRTLFIYTNFKLMESLSS